MRRLVARLFGVNVVAVLVSLLLMISIFALSDRRAPGHRVKSALAYSLPLDAEPGALERRLTVLGDEGMWMSVYSPDGRVLGSNVEPPLPFHPPRGRAGRRYAEVRDDDGTVQARVAFGAPERPLLNLRTLGGTALLLYVILALALSFWATRRIVKPIARLSAAAEAVGSGDFDVRVGSQDDDEIGRLSRTFDQMTARLSKVRENQRGLLANVSHEFRTPLARMRLALALIREGDEPPGALVPELETDLEELDRLIERVLTATRPSDESAGPSALALSSIDVAELMSRIANRFELAHSNRALTLRLPKRTFTIVVDVPAVLRAMDNLLSNAVTSARRGQIELTGELADDRVRLSVADRGEGPPRHLADRIFEPFVRGGPTGSGLGLAITAAVARAHGGTVRVRRRSGGGSIFDFEIPTRPSTEAASHAVAET